MIETNQFILKMYYKIALIVLFNFYFKILSAQEIQANGKKSFIVVMPDGSYETYSSKNKVHQEAMKYYKEKEKQKKKIAKQQAEAIKKAQKEQEKADAIAKKKEKEQNEKGKKIDDKKGIANQEKETKTNRKPEKLTKANKDAIPAQTVQSTAATKEKKSTKKDNPKTKPPKTELPNNAIQKGSKEKLTNAAKKEQNRNRAIAPTNSNTAIRNGVTEEKITKFQPLPLEKDVMLNPPTAPCAVVHETIDDFTKKKRRESEQSLLFQYTDESMKKYYDGADFVTCYAAMASLETGYKYLNLEFKIASDNVSTSYGLLEKDNHLVIKFLDGSTLTLFNSKSDRGTVDNVNRTTTYKGIFPIGSGEEKLLSKGEIDAIRVEWSTGTEDYEIYDVDFLANLLKCFKEN
jgi:hypothetical protein